MSNGTTNAGRPPIPMLEVLRRLLLIAGALAAVLCLLWPSPVVVRVGIPDFRQMKRERSQSLTTAPATVDLQAFIEEKTSGRLRPVDDPRWLDFYRSLALADEAKPSPLGAHLGSDISANYHYFRLDQPAPVPLTDVLAESGATYVKVENGGYLEVTPVAPRDAARRAPSSIAFPWRHLAPWLLAAAVAAYAVLPWPRAGQNVLRYAVGRAVIIPDLVGTAIAALLFAMPLLIVADAAKAGFPLLSLEGGWIWLTLGLWLLALVAMAPVAFGLWYASASVCIGESGIVITSLIRAKRCAYDQIASVEPAAIKIPRWLSIAIYFASIIDSPRGHDSVVGRDAYGADIRLRDGHAIRVVFSHLVGVESLLAQLKRHGIPVSRDLVAMFGDQEYAARQIGPGFWRSRPFGLAVAGVIIVCCSLLAVMPSEQYPPRARMPELNEEDIAAQEQLLVRMKQLQVEMSALLKKIEASPVAQRAELLDQYKVLAARYDSLSREAADLGASSPDR